MDEIAERLRRMRRTKKIKQSRVAHDLGLSVSEISRIERGRRRLRVDQLKTWAQSLRFRVEVLFWESDQALELDDESLDVLREVAASLPSMPGPARQALVHELRLWRENAAAK